MFQPHFEHMPLFQNSSFLPKQSFFFSYNMKGHVLVIDLIIPLTVPDFIQVVHHVNINQGKLIHIYVIEGICGYIDTSL